MTGLETMQQALDAIADPTWTFRADGYDSLRESSVESRFAISNGFLGVRGSRATTRGERWVMPARTYVAGLFDTSGIAGGTPGLVPAADWLKVRVVLPSGKTGYVAGDQLLSLGNEQLCYAKEGNAWKIAGFISTQ